MIFSRKDRPSEDGEGSLWLIVGLGNPGAEYERTRHNAGFLVIDRLAAVSGSSVRRTECRSLIGRAEIEGTPAELVKPQTYMNLSGEALACLLRKEERSLERTLVIVDDLALPFGSIRLRTKGSAGGHNGLRSIIGSLKTEEFARLRIGISPDHPVANTKKFVLDNFPAADSEKLAEVVDRSAEAAIAVICKGFASAMSEFNG
ncbi:MAG: aminoacyl-tRNA hydrolase [Acidobacteriota bacterium]|nr:MAG: aminoacyl-tRNA hydrolase [Acidobacteriota bacterium]